MCVSRGRQYLGASRSSISQSMSLKEWGVPVWFIHWFIRCLGKERICCHRVGWGWRSGERGGNKNSSRVMKLGWKSEGRSTIPGEGHEGKRAEGMLSDDLMLKVKGDEDVTQE